MPAQMLETYATAEHLSQAAGSLYMKPAGASFQYGTAGFRMLADQLPSVVFRVGILSVLRAHALHSAIGVMITASHNPVQDNGVKVVDPMGEMLASHWESYATRLANAENEQGLAIEIQDIIKKEALVHTGSVQIIVGRDTRPSGVSLVAALKAGIEAFGGVVVDYGVLTTPQLHFMVRCINTKGAYGEASENGYYKKLAEAYKTLLADATFTPKIVVDAANGVGAEKMRALAQIIGEKYLNVTIINDGTDGALNHLCGADHVKVQQGPPTNATDKSLRYASLDGDADRLVYFYFDQGQFKLLDGDKIAGLSAQFIGSLAKTLHLNLNVGVVQTAYANGNATRYIEQTLRLPVACVETGVKHLHHKAEEYDVGVYFEANGHGTVLFSDEALKKIASVNESSLNAVQKLALHRLKAVTEVINQAVGDAISILLFVEAVLLIQNTSLAQWDAAYTDLPSRQMKVKVSDRGAFKTTKADTVLVSPSGFQKVIDDLVSKVELGRSFVRPSGTEDVVRIYAEAKTRESCDTLAHQVALAVHSQCGGVGPAPTRP